MTRQMDLRGDFFLFGGQLSRAHCQRARPQHVPGTEAVPVCGGTGKGCGERTETVREEERELGGGGERRK